MKVIGLVNCAGVDFTLSCNSPAELPDNVALLCIRDGLCKAAVEQDTPPPPPVETPPANSAEEQKEEQDTPPPPPVETPPANPAVVVNAPKKRVKGAKAQKDVTVTE